MSLREDGKIDFRQMGPTEECSGSPGTFQNVDGDQEIGLVLGQVEVYIESDIGEIIETDQGR